MSIPPAKPATSPIYAINKEADAALKKILFRYAIIVTLVFFADVGIFALVYALLSPRFHSHAFMDIYSQVSGISCLIWMIPFYIGMQKYAEAIINFGRQYVDERRWEEAYLALENFAQFGMRSFDRTGEAHYLLSVAMDHTNRKNAAEKAREFVRKHRAGTIWAEKSGGPKVGSEAKTAENRSQSISGSHLRKTALITASDIAEEANSSKHKPMPISKGRKRRF